jgi:hypothetical protein
VSAASSARAGFGVNGIAPKIATAKHSQIRIASARFDRPSLVYDTSYANRFVRCSL